MPLQMPQTQHPPSLARAHPSKLTQPTKTNRIAAHFARCGAKKKLAIHKEPRGAHTCRAARAQPKSSLRPRGLLSPVAPGNPITCSRSRGQKVARRGGSRPRLRMPEKQLARPVYSLMHARYAGERKGAACFQRAARISPI